MAKRKRRHFTDEYKAEAVRLVRESGLSVAQVANRVWASAITTVRTWEGWLHLSVVLDLCSRRVVGWSMADHLRSDLVMDALRMAIGLRRPKPGHLLHHSDRGSQFAGQEFQDLLEAHKISCSMSRRGDCWTMRRWRASSGR